MRCDPRISRSAATPWQLDDRRRHRQSSDRRWCPSQNPRKYQDDAVTLWEILKEEEDSFLRSRYQFYLDQSLCDAGELEAAIYAYQGRATMGGWPAEIFVSHYHIGRLREQLGAPQDEVIAAYLHAHDASPSRAKSLVAAARFARQQSRVALPICWPPGDGAYPAARRIVR